ncbi:MAG: alkaline phosphatase family protein [Ramlibacter sp.]|nr:alkaline phosphatase family protein [Ramlibacter sp.]
MRLQSLQLMLSLVLACVSQIATAQSAATLHLVFVLDGLRPDSITEAETPNLHRLRKEGVWFENTHAVFPTVTRVNSTSLATGTYPARHGIMGNSIYVPAVDPLRAFTNDNFERLLQLDEATSGRMVTTPGVAELLERSGRKMVVVSSGSTGSALLLAPKAHRGIGTVINGDFVPGKKVAYPDPVSDTVLQRFGPAPKKGGATDRFDASVDWSMNVLRDYVLPELRPNVVFTWMTEPDHIQHGLGSGAAESLAAIRNDDRQLGLLVQKLEALGLRDKTNIMVVSDHGFAHTVSNVNVEQALTESGFIAATDPGALVIASSGQAVSLHVRDRDPRRIQAIVEFLQRQTWCGVVFTAAGRPGPAHEGAVAGTFALEYAHLGGHERSADIVFTFPWSSAPNRYGVPGTEHNLVSGAGKTGPVDGVQANHGGIGPWTIRNTMLANGPDFKRGAVVRTPTSNVDVTPTLLHLLGLTAPLAEMDGRALTEALVKGPDQEQVPMDTRALRVRSGAYSAVLQVSEVDGKRYIDKAWRD